MNRVTTSKTNHASNTQFTPYLPPGASNYDVAFTTGTCGSPTSRQKSFSSAVRPDQTVDTNSRDYPTGDASFTAAMDSQRKKYFQGILQHLCHIPRSHPLPHDDAHNGHDIPTIRNAQNNMQTCREIVLHHFHDDKIHKIHSSAI